MDSRLANLWIVAVYICAFVLCACRCQSGGNETGLVDGIICSLDVYKPKSAFLSQIAA